MSETFPPHSREIAEPLVGRTDGESDEFLAQWRELAAAPVIVAAARLRCYSRAATATVQLWEYWQTGLVPGADQGSP